MFAMQPVCNAARAAQALRSDQNFLKIYVICVLVYFRLIHIKGRIMQTIMSTGSLLIVKPLWTGNLNLTFCWYTNLTLVELFCCCVLFVFFVKALAVVTLMVFTDNNTYPIWVVLVLGCFGLGCGNMENMCVLHEFVLDPCTCIYIAPCPSKTC